MLTKFCKRIGKKGFILLFGPLPFLVAFIIWILLFFSLKLVPDTTYTVIPYSDRIEGGNSTIDDLTVDDEGVALEYTLQRGVDFPYAGVTIYFGHFYNFKEFEHITVTISAARSQRVRLILTSYIEGFSNHSNPLSEMYCSWEVPVFQGKRRYRLSLDDYIVPDWWYVKNNLPLYDSRISADFSYISSIHIENDPNLSPGTGDRLVLNRLHISRSLFWPVSASILSLLYGLLVVTAVVYFKKREEKEDKHLSYDDRKKIDIVDPWKIDHEKLISTLNEHYTDSELTVQKASRISGVHYLKIPKILRKQYGLTFPQYLNSLRICEAKRLLEHSDMKIIEISFAVGYGNISHFNRYFRSAEGISPREYRKKRKEINNN